MNIKEIIQQIESTMKTSGDNYMKELVLTNRTKLRNTFCDECNSYSVYMMVHDELWNIISDGNVDIFLCPKCMEKRLGRKIELTDLKICNVNYPYFFASQFFENK